MSQEYVRKVYNSNKLELTSICKYINDEFPDADVRIDLFDSVILAMCHKKNNRGGFDETIFKIKNQNIVTSLEKLESLDFVRILKENNYIYFQMWESFGKCGGIIYCQSGVPDVSKINSTKKSLERMNDKNWFYYVERFE